MNNSLPTKPSFIFGYWRPWQENANQYNSYLDYLKDTSLAKYGADAVGLYIKQASKEQVEAISHLGQAIGRGMNFLSNQISDINETMGFLNRNMDIQIEQQKLSNLLLQNIAELMRVPDSEKERQHSIELGIKFLVNASKDSDLYADALDELLKAEALMKQDYFVLHRIGFIYLYVGRYLNPEKALDYFLRAAKYASVESDSQAARLANVLTMNFNTVNSELNNLEQNIGLLAADSFEKAAFAAYILGRFEEAVKYQLKAVKLNDVNQNRFLLAKYQVRNGDISEGINNLSLIIDDEPLFVVASFKEVDLINEKEVVKLIAKKNQKIDEKISSLIEKLKVVESNKAVELICELNKLSQKSFEIKVSKFKSFVKRANGINRIINSTELEIDSLISEIDKLTFCTLCESEVKDMINELKKAKDLSLEEMQKVLIKIKNQVDADRLTLGSKFAGGIVFYLERGGNHGLVCADKDFGEFVWAGRKGLIGASGVGVGNGYGIQNSRIIAEKASFYEGMFGIFKKEVMTAAKICLESNYNGFKDWYLPTKDELKLMYKTLNKGQSGGFKAARYWSSTEYDDRFAWGFTFKYGRAEKSNGSKLVAYFVRAVRAF